MLFLFRDLMQLMFSENKLINPHWKHFMYNTISTLMYAQSVENVIIYNIIYEPNHDYCLQNLTTTFRKWDMYLLIIYHRRVPNNNIKLNCTFGFTSIYSIYRPRLAYRQLGPYLHNSLPYVCLENNKNHQNVWILYDSKTQRNSIYYYIIKHMHIYIVCPYT